MNEIVFGPEDGPTQTMNQERLVASVGVAKLVKEGRQYAGHLALDFRRDADGDMVIHLGKSQYAIPAHRWPDFLAALNAEGGSDG